MDKEDDDEACEIDSEDSNEEENKNHSSSRSRKTRSKLEESVRSSRTATFKSVRGTAVNNISV